MAEYPVVLNICGEGEIEGALNLNNLAATMIPPEEIERTGLLLKADVLEKWPIDDNSIDLVIGNNIPGFDAKERDFIAGEALRVLKPSGHLKVHSMSGKIIDWDATMKSAGFILLRRESHRSSLGYAVACKSGEQ